MNIQNIGMVLVFFLISCTASARCNDEDKTEDGSFKIEPEEPEARKAGKSHPIYVCHFPGCYCKEGFLKTAICSCKSKDPNLTKKKLDFTNVNFPEKNHTLKISDCDTVQLDFEGKMKPIFDGIEISRIAKLIIKPDTLEKVDNLTVHDVGELLADEKCFANLTARYVMFENVRFSEGTVFSPNYILSGLKILNSTFASKAVIQLNKLAMNRTIVITKNQFQNPILLSVYSFNVTLNDNSFDSEMPNLTIRYVEKLVSTGNTHGSRKVPFPDVTGDRKRKNVLFVSDNINNQSLEMSKSQQCWLKSFASALSLDKTVQPRTLEPSSDDKTGCLTEQTEDITPRITVECPTEAYNDFVETGKILIPPRINNEGQRGGRTLNRNDEQEKEHAKLHKSEKKHHQKSDAPQKNISLYWTLLVLPLTYFSHYF